MAPRNQTSDGSRILPSEWRRVMDESVERHERRRRAEAKAIEWFGPKRLLVPSTRTGQFSARSYLVVHLRRPCGHADCFECVDMESVCLGVQTRMVFGVQLEDHKRVESLCGRGHRTRTPMIAPTAGWADAFIVEMHRRVTIDIPANMRASACQACATSAVARMEKAR